jgi:hypothetical protein
MGWLWETEETTNDTQGSVKAIQLKPLDFDTLWGNYPLSSITHAQGDKEDIFKNHCAINVSEALLKSNIKMKSFKGAACWSDCSTGNKGKHAIRAQELASWVKLKPFPGCPSAIKLTGQNYESYVQGKTGIIFFKDYWQRNGETGKTRTGDHIDLWNKNELASIGTIATWVRQTFSNFASEYFDRSDLKNSKEVLFWEIK